VAAASAVAEAVGPVVAVQAPGEELPVAGEQTPSWLKGFLSAEDLPRIQKAVEKAEAKTGAEIVPMIVRRSSVIGHLPLTITLILSFLMFVVAYEFRWAMDDYSTHFLIPIAVAVLALLSFPLSRLHRIQRFLIPNADETLQSHRRAAFEFASMKIAKKKNRQGILLFVSMMERKVVVLPDQGLSELLPYVDTVALAQSFGQRLHSMPWGQAFEETLAEVASKLEKVLPRDAGSTDELGNGLQIKE
jgi:putative membrane protein